MLILTILKVLAWIWGVAIIIVLVVDTVDLICMLRKGHQVKFSVYLKGTLWSCVFAPMVYPFIVGCVVGKFNEWYKKNIEDCD